MKIAAVIAEYNPFHNGHSFHINETRRQTGADYIVVLMSGDYVQRGTPALCNKYIRTQMALAGGADMVLELPTLYALSSAEFFAEGGVSILNQLGIIDYLSFGSECGDINALDFCAHKLATSSSMQNQISAFLKQGLSYPVSREKAFLSDLSAQEQAQYSDILASPNNILGIEYCKAIKRTNSPIVPFTLKRQGTNYHDTSMPSDTAEFCSASAIRVALKNQNEEFKTYVPDSVYELLCNQNKISCLLTADDFSSLLYYKLLSEKETGFSKYLDCNSDISDKNCKHLPYYQGFSTFCTLLKSKDITYTRISRILMHILLNITTPDFYMHHLEKRNLYAPYVRLLGFRKEASVLTSSIKKNSNIPLLSNLADAANVLTPDALSMLKKDIFCCDIYEAVIYERTKRMPLNEYKQAPIIL